MSARVDGTSPEGSRKLAGRSSLPDNGYVHTCEVCNAKVGELRRGRCWGCYARWVDARPVGYGARCVTCSERRRRVLKMVELFGGWSPLCFNCAGQVLQLDPMPPSLAALRDAVSRERRREDRRTGKPDTRVFRYERRVGERRAEGDGEGYARIDDDMIVEVAVEDAAPERDARDARDAEDVTRIRTLASLDDVVS